MSAAVASQSCRALRSGATDAVAMPKRVTCVLLGDTGVGKTALCNAYRLKPFRWFRPKAGLNGDYMAHMNLHGIRCDLRVFDAKSDLNDAVKRQKEYRRCRVIVICFAIDNRASFNSARDYWLAECQRYRRHNSRLIIVGTKVDRRGASPPPEQLVSFEEGESLACSSGADVYLECSPLNGSGVDLIFEEMVRAFRRERNTSVRHHREAKCSIS